MDGNTVGDVLGDALIEVEGEPEGELEGCDLGLLRQMLEGDKMGNALEEVGDNATREVACKLWRKVDGHWSTR